jgi:hypothetical protein
MGITTNTYLKGTCAPSPRLSLSVTVASAGRVLGELLPARRFSDADLAAPRRVAHDRSRTASRPAGRGSGRAAATTRRTIIPCALDSTTEGHRHGRFLEPHRAARAVPSRCRRRRRNPSGGLRWVSSGRRGGFRSRMLCSGCVAVAGWRACRGRVWPSRRGRRRCGPGCQRVA